MAHNADNTIWAVNYHETSNFDSVDLIVARDDRVLVLPNIWSNLEERLKAERLLPNVPFDRCRLSVTSVEADTLNCAFKAFSRQIGQEIARHFAVAVKREPDKVEFTITR
jgi:hypothetical protein